MCFFNSQNASQGLDFHRHCLGLFLCNDMMRNVFLRIVEVEVLTITICIEKEISNLVRMTRFWGNIFRNDQSQNNLKVFENNKTNGPIQDSQHRLWSPMLEREQSSLQECQFVCFTHSMTVYHFISNTRILRLRNSLTTSSHAMIMLYWLNIRFSVICMINQ
jgi:hypothetical protein